MSSKYEGKVTNGSSAYITAPLKQSESKKPQTKQGGDLRSGK